MIGSGAPRAVCISNAPNVDAKRPGGDPFAFVRPSVAITEDDRRQLDRGASIARILPGQDREVAVFAAVAVDIDGDRLGLYQTFNRRGFG